ncbi:MAG: response regulator [Proteobacteria bacterium]|nr:response regulator [Pseudomonadota bacterium]
MKVKKVLVVEDEADTRWGICHYLRKEGYSVLEAENGLVAKDILQKEKVDVILSDLRMPKMDGAELLKYCRDNKNQAIFILMTAYGDCQSYCDIMSLGAYEYMNKPVLLDEIRNLFKKIEREKQ